MNARVFRVVFLSWLSAPVLAASPTPQDLGELPAYPGVALTRIGDDLAIGGQYYRLGYFTTTDSPKAVVQHFAKVWKGRGLPVVVDGDFTSETIVSAFFTRQGIQRSVIVRRHGEKTLAFVSLRDLWVKAPAARSEGLVSLDGVLLRQDLLTREDPEQAQHRSSLIAGAMDPVKEALLRALSARGYALVHESAVGTGLSRRFVVVHAKGAERVTTTLSRVDDTMTGLLQTAIRPVASKAQP